LPPSSRDWHDHASFVSPGNIGNIQTAVIAIVPSASIVI
jgi:hypothetical protein